MALLDALLKIEVFKLGEFVLKSGVSSPIYIDLRSIIAFPNIVQKISEEIRRKQMESDINMDVVCGVPYTALPIATVFSVQNSVRMIMKRKEAKSYGTKKMVEGIYTPGNKCLIIEDIVSSGSSIIETAEVLRKEGLVVSDCIAILNRKQGGAENLSKNGITLHSLFDINQLFERYCCLNNVDNSLIEKVNKYFKDNYIPLKPVLPRVFKSFKERAALCKQPVVQKLFRIMSDKETNLCVSVDVVHSEDLLRIANEIGPYICVLKTHMDILVDFTTDVSKSLRVLADLHNFLIMEDRKFGDIGNTVMHQYADGLYHIKNWADLVTVHGIPGSGQIQALKSVAEGCDRACVLVAEMSSKGALTDESYQNKIVEMAKEHPDFVVGFVCQHELISNDAIVHMTPGVNICDKGDTLGQQYNSPGEVVKNGADIIIVGRGICNSSNVVETAKQYRNEGYKAYENKYQA